MPKVTEEYREARRDRIARAAIRCLERNGVRDTSIADIVEESGLSTGAIYSHFTNKGELARYIVGRFLIVRLDELEARGASGALTPPREVLVQMLDALARNSLPPALIVQFWGEAMVDPQLHSEMTRTAGRLGIALATAVTPWARARLGAEASDSAVDDLVARTARTIAALTQGYIANTAVFGPRDPAEYVGSVSDALTD